MQCCDPTLAQYGLGVVNMPAFPVGWFVQKAKDASTRSAIDIAALSGSFYSQPK